MKSFLLLILLCGVMTAQDKNIPSYYEIDENLTNQLKQLVQHLELDKDFDVGEDGIEQISLAVIKIEKEKAYFAGVNPENFIYPASVYKMYVAAEILNQVSQGKYSLYDEYVVKSPNDVDRSKEIKSDPRPLLRDGDAVTINYLLDLMITRSDNSAANCLIDKAGRENINKLMHDYNWQGSEVTRKFLSRKFEDPGYEKIRGTETCALHAADFMYLVYRDELVNPWVSKQMKTLLGRQLDKSKLASGLLGNTMSYHKTGWYSYWNNDVGIIDDGEVQYIISCFIPLREEFALPKFKKLAEGIHELIKSGN